MSGPAPTRSGSAAAVGIGVAAAVALVVVLLLVVLWVDGGRAAFVPRGTAAATGALEAAGLAVCARTARPDAATPAALDAVTLDVAADRAGCTTGPVARVGVEAFADADDRDAAARVEEVRVRPRGSALVHTLDDLVIIVPGLADDDLTDRITAALTARGAR